ncbi:MAG: ABC transporter permease subunit [Gammaproteobacteria bacterium]|jgi:oligopeptide transport system permease protein|nr:ABC transporter permease subunit [Gammaproteobacteria bacterium]
MSMLGQWRQTLWQQRPRSLWADALTRLMRNRAAMLACVLLLLIVVLVCAGPLLSPWDAEIPDWDNASMPPDLSSKHWFGTDAIGRDLFVRVLEGGRVSLLVALLATIVSLVIGVSYGAIAGYFGGRLDAMMMRMVDILYALPFLFFVILLIVIFQRNILLIFIAIGAINWLDMARIVRGQTLSLRNRPFVHAAEAIGVQSKYIISRHIVPNLLGVVVVYATLTIPQIILMESFLSFLGLGVQEPATSWGALVSDGAQEMQTAPWSLLFPGMFLVVTLFCFNFIGDGLRDALDPREHL